MTQRMFYRVAAQTIMVEAEDSWSAGIVKELFAGWYLIPDSESPDALISPAIVIRSGVNPPEIPRVWPQFEVAGGGVCFSDSETSYIDIEGSIVAIGGTGYAPVEVWTKGKLDFQSPTLTRVVTYALAAALRRRRLFELHSGAVIDPRSKKGVLIIGPSGSGKSTLTVQLATAGWPFLTDDVLLLSAEGVAVKAWPLRRCFAVTAETVAASNFLQANGSLDYNQAKTVFSPHQVFNSEFQGQCVPQTLFFTQLSGGERSEVSRLTPADAMSLLLRINPWSCYDRHTAADHLQVLSALTKQTTGYSLLAGKDLLDPERAAELISKYTCD